MEQLWGTVDCWGTAVSGCEVRADCLRPARGQRGRTSDFLLEGLCGKGGPLLRTVLLLSALCCYIFSRCRLSMLKGLSRTTTDHWHLMDWKMGTLWFYDRRRMQTLGLQCSSQVRCLLCLASPHMSISRYQSVAQFWVWGSLWNQTTRYRSLTLPLLLYNLGHYWLL